MPIANTFQPRPSFREVGKIKKGVMVQPQGKRPYPREVDYIVMAFNPEEAEVESTFWENYPPQPKAIRIRAPFNKIEDWWDGWYKCFKGTRMIAKAGLNPELAKLYGYDPAETMFFERLFDAEFGQWVVKRWSVLSVDNQDLKSKWALQGQAGKPLVVNMLENIDPRNGEPLGPVIYNVQTKDKNGKETGQKPYYLSPVGDMLVAVTELIPYMGFLKLHTTGKVDINNISGELAGIAMRAEQAGIALPKIPLILYRRKEAVRDPDGNLTYHWNFHVGIDPEYSQRMAQLMQAQVDTAFALVAPDVKQLEAGPDEGIEEVLTEEDVEDGYFEELGPEEEEDPEPVELPEDIGEVVIANYKDLWLFAEKLGIDMQAERSTVNDIWKQYENSPDKAIKAVMNLAGKE